MQFSLSSLALLSLPLLASAQQASSNQQPFPVMTRSAPLPIISKISSDVQSYITGVYGSPAYTSAVGALALEAPDFFNDNDVQGNPVSIAEIFLTATATPSWYTQLPTDIQSFVYSVAAAQATIVQKDTSGAERQKSVWLSGAVVAAGVVGLILL